MFELVAWLIIATLIVIPAWRILRKAGFIPALSLVLIVPILGWFLHHYRAGPSSPGPKTSKAQDRRRQIATHVRIGGRHWKPSPNGSSIVAQLWPSLRLSYRDPRILLLVDDTNLRRAGYSGRWFSLLLLTRSSMCRAWVLHSPLASAHG
jgi:hypothetical protein